MWKYAKLYYTQTPTCLFGTDAEVLWKQPIGKDQRQFFLFITLEEKGNTLTSETAVVDTQRCPKLI